VACAAVTLAVAGAVSAGGCKASAVAPAPPATVACDASSAARAMTPFAATDVAVSLESGGDAGLEIVRGDVAKYVGTLWGGTFAIATTAPDFSKRATIWLSTSAAAIAKAGLAGDMAYAITRSDSSTGTVVTVAARDPESLAFGAYALLEELGARFFHPKQELVPSFGGPRIPASLAIARVPAMASRGHQFHALHPIEYMETLQVPSAANLADAKQLIDWLVKTGQNFLQWPLLSTVPFAAWVPHAQAIIAYAHQRGVRVGAGIEVWGGAALQNNYSLVTDETNWMPEMDAGLDQLVPVGFDVFELALGEFVSDSPQSVIDWLNHAVAHMATASPTTEVYVENHVGNYPNLWVQYQGQTVYYYHLPQFADPRLGQDVHTLSFFDVYRDWATYKHPNFHLQHDYIVRELPTRKVKYFPESAYWISADSDVPLFLPMTLVARWNDINGLVNEARAAGLELAGHVLFTSGHEWGFWMTDYLTAKMLWQPDAPLASLVQSMTRSFGSCGADVGNELEQLIDVQTRSLFDQRLAAYLQAEDSTVDFGNLIGNETHPNRIPFETVLTMSASDQAAFESSVLDGLDRFVDEVRPIEEALAARCRGADATLAPWCGELLDGTSIVRNRGEHVVLLYRAILAKARGADPEPYYTVATTLTAEAAQIIAGREAHYRFDLTRLTGVYQNPTIYDYGYLRPAHTQCYWHRREMQVRSLLDSGFAATLSTLPACADEPPTW
jgi:hypothetical protein